MRSFIVALALFVVTGCAASHSYTRNLELRTGSDYVFVWDCIPAAPACYGDIVKVLGELPNGWLVVRGGDGKEWLLNPSRAIMVAPYQRPAVPSLPKPSEKITL